MTRYSFLCRGRAFIPAALVFFLLSLVSCADDEDVSDVLAASSWQGAPYILNGTWDGEYDGEVYTIDTIAKTFDSAGAYAGDDMIIVYDSAADGRFIIKYTRALIPNALKPPYYSTKQSEAPDIGKWYAIYFRIIDYNTIQVAGGWKNGGPNAFSTADECRASATREGGYFAMTSECRRRM